MVFRQSFEKRCIIVLLYLAFHPKTGLDMLQVQPVSKAQARQRTGRAGRETSGVCYRLYTEEQFDELKETTIPEIQRCNIATVILHLMALGITDVANFDFLDRPPQDAIENALEQLIVLGAVRKGSDCYEVRRIYCVYYRVYQMGRAGNIAYNLGIFGKNRVLLLPAQWFI